MSEVTAVPLRPITKGSLVKLWVGVAVVIAIAMFAAYAGTAKQVAMAMSPNEFLASNGKKSGVVTLPSGLQYEILQEGSGPKPGPSDVVLVDYEGKLANGEVFDSSARHGGPQPLPLQGMIPGWTEGLQLMNTGSKYRFWMPPALGFGETGAPPKIPGNALVSFDVTLNAIMPPQALGMGGMPPGHGGM
ncbi:FKBP-type peptidyl-prolyl cis-trans isomerase [Rhizorhabdus argentea]|uniref:FKBP-type peptidyl-prolyl cis-trans isomerase n=1 Tax=Rhizorhabdus argentea TaxID=1387174 RepID=UPI0030EC854C